ncbi:MAG: purine-binding chemotaxis protein CheW [Xanthomonadaceae bacterium]|nr:purine-binding chemotaxis protein CheW [Xanthomonadaceae bacterium]
MADQFVVFVLGEQRYALRLSAVDRVVRMVQIAMLLKAPDVVLGVVNVQGCVLPVISLRRRFRLPEREIGMDDQLVIAHTARRAVALVVDAVTDVIDCSGRELVAPQGIISAAENLSGIIKGEDGLILVHDLDVFLSQEEENFLDQALEAP